MADQVTILDIAEPMQDRAKKDGSGTYRAMKITVKMPDGALKTIMSFDEHKVGEQVSVEEKNGYVNLVKPSRGYDTPAKVGFSDVMQALRFQYELSMKINAKVDAILKDIGVDAPADTAASIKVLASDVPASGFDQFKAAREEHGFTKAPDNLPTDDDLSSDIDLSEIPF